MDIFDRSEYLLEMHRLCPKKIRFGAGDVAIGFGPRNAACLRLTC